MPFDSLPITSPVINMLRVGRALIETHGLAKGFIEDDQGRFCTVGGVSRQSRRPMLGMYEALEYLARAIGVVPIDHIGKWNDAPERTQADVLAAYDKAIELAVADQLAGN
jgi:hypothetical protein